MKAFDALFLQIDLSNWELVTMGMQYNSGIPLRLECKDIVCSIL
jgi:hypothetical protein